MKIYHPIFLFFLFDSVSYSQSVELKLADELSNLFGDTENSIKKATVQTESEKTVGIQIEISGFKNKNYIITAIVLNNLKQAMKEFPKIEIPLDKRSGLADFFFNFKQLSGKQYSQAFIESGFVQFSVAEKDGLGAGVGLDLLGIDSKIFTFKYKKKWPIKGGGSQEVLVKLTPFKSAASIQQGK